MKPQHFWMLVIVAGGVLLLGRAAFKITANADFNVPQFQQPAENDIARFKSHNLDGHPGHVYENHAGYVYTPHRYPRALGGEISALIHNGFSSMRIPCADYTQWMTSPPSEAMWA